MMTVVELEHVENVKFYDLHPPLADFKQEVLEGLKAKSKYLSPKFFYDKQGSELFNQITKLPEYYPTNTEITLLDTHQSEMVGLLGENCVLIELGSGSSHKIRTLLTALEPAAYVPMDISKQHLLDSANILAEDYPDLSIHAVCADYSTDFELPYRPDDLPHAAFFPGSSIGNFEPDQAQALLARTARLLGQGGRLLIGVDLKKDQQILHDAYNDAQGVTAAFNLNLLKRINEELGGNFVIENFKHDAFYNADLGRVEMHLVSKMAQKITIDGHVFSFDRGESIHTESSYKYSVSEFQQLAEKAGYAVNTVWTDEQNLFSVHCFQVK